MIKKGISVKKCNKKKQILHGILIGNHGSGFLSWELVKFTKLGHQLVSVYFSSSGSGMTVKDPASKKILSINKDHSRFCRGFSTVKKVSVKGSISQESLIKRVLKRLAKHCEDMTVIVETDQENTLGSWISCARFCTDWLSGTTAILVSTRNSILQLRGFRLNSRPEFDFDKKGTSLGYAEEVVVENISESEVILISEDALRDGSEESSDHSFDRNHGFEEENSLTSISLIRKELPESALGWPMRRRHRTRNKSVVEWVMSMPSRNNSVDWNETNTSPDRGIDNLSVLEDHHNIERRIRAAEDESKDDSQTLEDSSGNKVEEVVFSSSSLPSLERMLSQPKLGWPLLRITVPESQESSREFEDSISSIEFPKESNLVHKLISSNCKQFSYAELESATSQFSSENLIGEGGCSNVYKGCLSDGKLVAVKVLKSYREAWNDFCLEADITFSLKHKNITPLVGVCMEDNIFVLVYDFLPKGSLDEVLHGQEGTQLPWEVRFKAAVAIADALNYLHTECSKPVIHRDIKSSNILLSNELEPQLSDFGLAIWVPIDSTYTIHEDVAGTFGYIAPEYFMHGRLSDKIDVYSYGVVLLELISGRKPIASKNLEVQESLIKWATPLLKTGDVDALLDPNLVDDYYDSDQMQRMVLVANLCINQPARLRPKATQILRLLTGEDDGKEYGVKGSCNQEEEDDDLLEFDGKPRLDLSLSFLYTDVDAVSLSSVDTGNREQKRRLKLKDYLKQQQD
ncbi:hypothetical protein Dsin_003747 [Dipteronia sinensis]|uniref:Protein kinase domain-containing protein n=1 Tax=Dipteronia sinensis TaxID=43782 RepID=A0AAE0B861_9ROSI|nr:hypothetical protein Dsin_003747 [Dipteronia sinensis]